MGSPFLKRGPLEPTRLFAIRIQFFTELRVCDLDERFGALANGLAVEIRNTEFGDDVVDVTA